jgi:hypothetical protein
MHRQVSRRPLLDRPWQESAPPPAPSTPAGASILRQRATWADLAWPQAAYLLQVLQELAQQFPLQPGQQ